MLSKAIQSKHSVGVQHLYQNLRLQTGIVRETPLVSYSQVNKIPVLIKKESQQAGGSIKTYSTSNFLQKMIHRLRVDEKNKHAKVQVATHSHGDYGLSFLYAANQLRNESSNKLEWLDPVVYTSHKTCQDSKLSYMKTLADLYHRERTAGDIKKTGVVVTEDQTYPELIRWCNQFMVADGLGHTVYAYHNHPDSLFGTASLALEIEQQLQDIGIGQGERIGLYMYGKVPTSLGLLYGMKLLRPTVGCVVEDVDDINHSIREAMLMQSYADSVAEDVVDEYIPIHKSQKETLLYDTRLTNETRMAFSGMGQFIPSGVEAIVVVDTNNFFDFSYPSKLWRRQT